MVEHQINIFAIIVDKRLDPGDEVMADRGFQIKEDLLFYYCSLNVPPGARVKVQLTSS